LYYALGLFALAGSGILSNTFVILGDTLTPMIAGTIAIGINIGLNLLFALAWGMGAPGLALATTISGTLNFCALLLLLQKKFSAGIFGGLWLPVGKTLLASGIMGTACYFLWRTLEGIWHPTQYGPRLGLVLLVVLIGISLYALLSWLLRIPEFDRYRGYLLVGIGKLKQITGRTKT
jgi:putative peptidoglycan lipid II flippase